MILTPFSLSQRSYVNSAYKESLMPERLDDITVEELSLVPKGAHPGTDFVPLSKSADNENVEEEITENQFSILSSKRL